MWWKSADKHSEANLDELQNTAKLSSIAKLLFDSLLQCNCYISNGTMKLKLPQICHENIFNYANETMKCSS